ncbi:MAG: hypothetical protein ACOVLB_06225 [Candidatus Nanopelagicus sp.]
MIHNDALVRELAMQNERIANLYTIGPVQRAEVTQFVEAVVMRCIQCVLDYDDPIIAVYIADTFGIKT